MTLKTNVFLLYQNFFMEDFTYVLRYSVEAAQVGIAMSDFRLKVALHP